MGKKPNVNKRSRARENSKTIVVAKLIKVAGHALTCRPNRSSYAGPGETEANRDSVRPGPPKTQKSFYHSAHIFHF